MDNKLPMVLAAKMELPLRMVGLKDVLKDVLSTQRQKLRWFLMGALLQRYQLTKEANLRWKWNLILKKKKQPLLKGRLIPIAKTKHLSKLFKIEKMKVLRICYLLINYTFMR